VAHDQHSAPHEFHVGQQVIAKNLRPRPTWLPITISERLGPLTYLVDVSGKLWKCHIDYLQKSSDQPPEHSMVESDEIEIPAVTSLPDPSPVPLVVPAGHVEPNDVPGDTPTDQNITSDIAPVAEVPNTISSG